MKSEVSLVTDASGHTVINFTGSSNTIKVTRELLYELVAAHNAHVAKEKSLNLLRQSWERSEHPTVRRCAEELHQALTL